MRWRSLIQSVLFLTVAAVSVLLFLVARHSVGLQDRAMQDKLESIRAENRSLKLENARLRSWTAALREDNEALDKIAREQLGYIRDGEVIVVLPE